MSISGGDKVAIELARRWKENGNEVNIAMPYGWYGYFCCKKLGLNVVSIFPRAGFTRHNGLFICNVYLMRILGALSLKQIKSEVIFSSSDLLCDTLPAFQLRSVNPKPKWMAAVYHLIPNPARRIKGFTFSNMLSYSAQWISLKLISRGADVIFTENSYLKNSLVKEFKIPNEKIKIMSGGIDANYINKVKCDRRKAYDACFIGRIHSTKGIFDLVKAWRDVCTHIKGAKLAIIGSGSTNLIQELKNEIRRLNLEVNIDMLGFVSDEEKYKTLKASRIFILPSFEEGIPIVFYEAMYCGLPVVTYRLPSYVDIESSIVQVALGDTKALARAIINLLTDENALNELGTKGKKLAREHDWSEISKCLFTEVEALFKAEQ